MNVSREVLVVVLLLGGCLGTPQDVTVTPAAESSTTTGSTSTTTATATTAHTPTPELCSQMIGGKFAEAIVVNESEPGDPFPFTDANESLGDGTARRYTTLPGVQQRLFDRLDTVERPSNAGSKLDHGELGVVPRGHVRKNGTLYYVRVFGYWDGITEVPCADSPGS